VQTGPVDHAEWNHRLLLGYISRRRFRMVLDLLGGSPVERLLEIGYGSGVFMPELASHCRELFGVDVHERSSDVAAILSARGIHADLRRASATALPFESGTFDVVVAVSALEFIEDLPAASREIVRVLRPTGRLIAVTPGQGALLDGALRLVAGVHPDEDYGDRRGRTIPTLLETFTVEAERVFPPNPAGRLLPVYRALRLAPRPWSALPRPVRGS